MAHPKLEINALIVQLIKNGEEGMPDIDAAKAIIDHVFGALKAKNRFSLSVFMREKNSLISGVTQEAGQVSMVDDREGSLKAFVFESVERVGYFKLSFYSSGCIGIEHFLGGGPAQLLAGETKEKYPEYHLFFDRKTRKPTRLEVWVGEKRWQIDIGLGVFVILRNIYKTLWRV